MNKKAYGFTIVELLIVIVVIGILAAISIVAYNGITKRTTEVKIKTELSQVGKALQVDKAESDEYPDYLWATNDIDNIINQEDEQTYGYYQRDGGAGFCVDVISTKYRDLRFHLSNDSGSVQPGLCEENDNILNSERFVLENCFLFDKVEGAIIGYGWSRANVDDDSEFFYAPGPMGGADGWEIGTSCPMDVVIPSSIQGVSVVAIGGGRGSAFCTQNECNGIADGGRQLTSVVIPNTVLYIANGAFSRNALQSVTIPNSVTHIDESAFISNQITSLTLSDSVVTIGSLAFYRNQLTTVTLPPHIENVADSAFRYQFGVFDSGVACHAPHDAQIHSNSGCSSIVRY